MASSSLAFRKGRRSLWLGWFRFILWLGLFWFGMFHKWLTGGCDEKVIEYSWLLLRVYNGTVRPMAFKIASLSY